MATDEYLLDRLRNLLTERQINWDEKRMFGGICFMVDEKMCFGTFRNGLMVRVNPDEVEELLKKEHTEQMMQRDRIMKGYILVSPEGYDLDTELSFWVNKCIEWNPNAKSSKKKKKR